MCLLEKIRVLPTDCSSTVKPKTKARPPPPPFLVPLNIAFYICLIAHTLAASNAPIQDCDETFNYWEPLHYLTHGYGLQTWEYSPDYSIRSWAYILIHAIPTKIVGLLGRSKEFEFYALRCILALACAATETRLYSALCRALHARVGAVYLLIVAFTPGFFYASTAFLPSSFAMYTGTLGLSAFLDQREGSRTATATMWFGIGALLGWPFAGALIVPFVAEEWLTALTDRKIRSTFNKYIHGIVRCVAILIVQVGIDSAFYRKLVIVPWRIVAYNVFSGGERGPDIFGTEPWHFYIRNLLLNFNIWFPLALSAGPLLLLGFVLGSRTELKRPALSTLVVTTCFYLWFCIFTIQPHKEERFMFPAYPFLAANAAISSHILITWLFPRFIDTKLEKIVAKLPSNLRLLLITPIVVVSVTSGVLRIIGTVSSYSAPLKIFSPLADMTGLGSDTTTVCFGKDWYRFPTSFFLPNHAHPKFIKSAFDGLLPGEFSENNSLGLLPGTWMIPKGMNDRNEEDTSKHMPIELCSFLVDSSFPSGHDVESALEPNYIRDEKAWEKVRCEPFLDATITGTVGRLIWLPDWVPFVPSSWRRKWGQHCLLRLTSLRQLLYANLSWPAKTTILLDGPNSSHRASVERR